MATTEPPIDPRSVTSVDLAKAIVKQRGLNHVKLSLIHI